MTPARSDGSDASSGVDAAQRDGCHVGVHGDSSGSLDHGNVVGQSVGVVVGVVHYGRSGMVDSSSEALQSSNNDEGVSGGASNGAVSCGYNPTGAVDPTSTEMAIASSSERSLVGELASGSVTASHDTSLPVAEDVTSGESCW